MPGFSLESIACGVDLFRLPDGPPTRMGSSYYARDGTLDSNRQPVYQLLYTDYPEQIPGRPYEAVIGNHLIFESSAETHLLYRQTLSQLNQTADGRLLFTFGNIGVLQTGRYLLRYSVCNSRTHQTLVKCFGRPFTISSVNQFPGLQPATPLTQSLGGLRIPGMGGRH
ncbi:hypothetical protein C8R46DRAFT_9809 [Mycena filopes]|nr:hypothetical protein C8R46DRAFT_9809 [Mycena filopes]